MDIQIPQILFQIVNFSVVLGALSYLLYRPILKVLDERSQRIAEGQEAAQKAITEQKNIEDLKKQSKREAEKQASKLLDEAKKDADKQRDVVLAKAREQAKVEVAKLQADWQNEKKELVKGLKQQFAEAVIATAEKVMNSSLTAKTHSKLIDDELSQLLKSM